LSFEKSCWLVILQEKTEMPDNTILIYLEVKGQTNQL
jgi:hypothetical protein